jgi:hypothetical protein
MTKHLKVRLLLLLLTALGGTAWAADSAEADTISELIRLDHAWTEAEIRSDVAAISGLLAEDFISVSPIGSTADKEQFLRDYRSGDLKIASEQLWDYRVRLYGNTAVMMHVAILSGTYKGRNISGRNRSIHVWVKESGRWRIVANQGTPVVQERHGN